MKTFNSIMIVFVLGLYSMVFSQTEVTMIAIKDNTLYEDNSGSLSNGVGDYFFVGKTNNGEIRRTLLEFDIPSNIPENATIESATLTLYMSRTRAGNEEIKLHKVTAEWGEGSSDAPSNEGTGTTATSGDATWIHRSYDSETWDNAGGDFVSTMSASQTIGGTGSYTWGSTDEMVADVHEWLDNPASNFGWILIGNEQSNQTAKRFNSRHVSQESEKPQLTVQYTSPTVVSDPNSDRAPDDFALYQNYPNPFNPSTTIQFNLPEANIVTLKIYNLSGQEIKTLANGYRAAGKHDVKWTADELPSSIYLYRFRVGGFSATKKLILQK